MAWDDVSGNQLDPKMVLKAREEEMEQFRKHDVYEKVQEEVCWAVTGKAPIGTRWIDINKGDEVNPEYRSRLVAQQVKYNSKEKNIFAATPPLEAQKLFCRGRYRMWWGSNKESVNMGSHWRSLVLRGRTFVP